MEQYLSNRIICAAIVVLLGVFFGKACAMRPGGHLLPARAAAPAAPVLRVVSRDPVAARVVCESVARTGSFARIHCGGREPADLVLLIDTAVTDSSDDYSRNAGWSILTLTTALRVSTSARAVFRFRMGPPGGPYSEVIYASRGRIGMWSYLPFYTGLIATTLGTWLNDYRLPGNLRRECLAQYKSAAANTPALSPACDDYRDFMQDAYSKVRLRFWSALRELPREMSAARRIRNTPARFAKRDRESRSFPY